MRILPRKLHHYGISLLAGAIAVAVAGTAGALSFDSLAHGEIAHELDGVTITAENFNRNFHYAVGFDTRENGTRDPDLEAAGSDPFWSGGNITHEALNVILVIQENSYGCGDGVCNLPDDEGRRDAGNLIFDFDVVLIAFGFDVVDVEDAMAENGRVSFFVGNQPLAEVEFMDFVTEGSGFYDPYIEYGNNTANRISPITAMDLEIESFDRVIITMGGSGGIDNVVFEAFPVTNVPEPTTAILIVLGLLVASVSRRR